MASRPTTSHAILDSERLQTDCLVVVFLRGGADGLSLVAPTGDDGYHRARPTLALRREAHLALDARFTLHPGLAPLRRYFLEQELLVVHAAGCRDATRSHFEAQDRIEQGGSQASGGWLGRHLRLRRDQSESSGNGHGALTAVALGTAAPLTLRGAPSVTVFDRLDDFALGDDPGFAADLEELWSAVRGPAGDAARSALDSLARVENLRRRPWSPASDYPQTPFGRRLAELARLLEADLGVRAATIDLGGWDSHIAQAGLLEGQLADLGAGLGAFARDLGPRLASTTVVLMSEFGRRVRENSAFGTDHGRGGVLFLLGGGVRGGRVLAGWDDLDDDSLVGPGDLPVLHDYRDVLQPVLARHGAPDPAAVFPGLVLPPKPT